MDILNPKDWVHAADDLFERLARAIFPLRLRAVNYDLPGFRPDPDMVASNERQGERQRVFKLVCWLVALSTMVLLVATGIRRLW
jgi:hypothetical protein